LNWWKLFLRVNTRRERKKWKIKKFSFLSIALCTPSAFEELWNLKIFPLVLAQISCLQHWSWRYMWENVILHEIDSIYQRDISRSIILARIIYLVFVGFNFWNFKFVLVSISTKMRKKNFVEIFEFVKWRLYLWGQHTVWYTEQFPNKILSSILFFSWKVNSKWEIKCQFI
jgi:hypothetical protein